MALERLQKVLARAGLGSRRACEELITAGRVMVDGETVTELGSKVDPETQEIACDGQALHLEGRLTLVVHKPRGVVSTSDEREERPRVIDLVPFAVQRLYAVGRLDTESEGLVLVTNDGALANVLTHPRYEVPKTYVAEVRGDVTDEALATIRSGVRLAEGHTGPADVRVIERGRQGGVLEITIRRGINRQVRRVLARVGLKVHRLTRVAMGEIHLGGLKPGKSRRLSTREERYVSGLLAAAEARHPGRPRRRRR